MTMVVVTCGTGLFELGTIRNLRDSSVIWIWLGRSGEPVSRVSRVCCFVPVLFWPGRFDLTQDAKELKPAVSEPCSFSQALATWNISELYGIIESMLSCYLCYIYVMSRVYVSYLCHVSSSALSFSPPCPPAFPQPLDWGACLLSHSCDSCHFSVSLVALVKTLRAQKANSHQLLCTGLHQGLARSAHRTSLPQEGRWEWAKVKS